MKISIKNRPTTDDQIQARSTEPFAVKRKSGIAVVAVLLCVFAFAGLGIDFLLQPHRFPLKRIEIQGDLRNTYTQQIQRVLAENMPSNIFRINLAEAADVAQSLPWISEATIRRQWPDTLQVRVHEYVVEARWESGEWVDQSGKKVVLPDYQNSKLPVLGGDEEYVRDMLNLHRRWAGKFHSKGLEIRELRKSARGEWQIGVLPVKESKVEDSGLEDQSIRVVLGSGQPGPDIERFIWLYSEVFESLSDSLGSVDMRYPDGVAVQWENKLPKVPGSIKIKST